MLVRLLPLAPVGGRSIGDFFCCLALSFSLSRSFVNLHSKCRGSGWFCQRVLEGLVLLHLYISDFSGFILSPGHVRSQARQKKQAKHLRRGRSCPMPHRSSLEVRKRFLILRDQLSSSRLNSPCASSSHAALTGQRRTLCPTTFLQTTRPYSRVQPERLLLHSHH